MLQLNRFWSSVWSVFVYLVSVGLLTEIVQRVATLFGLLNFGGVFATLFTTLVAALTAIAGTLAYLDWRWNWKPEHIGMPRTAGAAGWVAAGVGLGALAGLLAYVAGSLAAGSGIPAINIPNVQSLDFVELPVLILALFAAEMVFRGAVISRYQADLSQREVLLMAIVTPLAWPIVQRILGQFILPLGGPSPALGGAWAIAESVVLSLLFLRTDSVWLSAGLRSGVLVVAGLFPAHELGHLLLWGSVAAVLLAMELIKQQRAPRRVQPGGGSYRTTRGRTLRGPWGPH